MEYPWVLRRFATVDFNTSRGHRHVVPSSHTNHTCIRFRFTVFGTQDCWKSRFHTIHNNYHGFIPGALVFIFITAVGRREKTLRVINTRTDITAALKRCPYEFTDCYGRNFRLMFPSLLPSSQINAVYYN